MPYKDRERQLQWQRDYRKRKYYEDIEKSRQYSRDQHRKHGEERKKLRAKWKMLVFEHYGNKCVCCGETEPKFLTIDHVNGHGNEHRRTMKRDCIESWLVHNNFPEGYQILCYNCNCGKARNNGICPHQDKLSNFPS